MHIHIHTYVDISASVSVSAWVRTKPATVDSLEAYFYYGYYDYSGVIL